MTLYFSRETLNEVRKEVDEIGGHSATLYCADSLGLLPVVVDFIDELNDFILSGKRVVCLSISRIGREFRQLTERPETELKLFKLQWVIPGGNDSLNILEGVSFLRLLLNYECSGPEEEEKGLVCRNFHCQGLLSRTIDQEIPGILIVRLL